MTDAILPAPAIRTWTGPLMLFCGGIAIGFAPIGMRLGLDDLGPQAIAFWRYAFAFPVLVLLFAGVERRWPKAPDKFILIAGTCFAVDMALWHWALTETSVANATFLVNLGSVAVGFTAWFFLKEKPRTVWFWAVPLAIAGAAALSLGGTPGGQASLKGDLIALGAAIAVSGYLLFSKLARRTFSGLEAIMWLTLVEILVGGVIVALSGESFLPADLSGLAAPLLLGLGAHVAGQGLIVAGLGRTPASIAGVLVLIQPVVAAAVSWQLFNEPMTALQAGGSALILFAVWLSQSGRRPQAID